MMNFVNYGIVLLLFVLFLSFIKTDIPVHCLHEEVKGEWDFYLFPVSIKDQRVFPHNNRKVLQCLNHDPKLHFEKKLEKHNIFYKKFKKKSEQLKKIRIKLVDPNIAYLISHDYNKNNKNTKNKDKVMKKGTWTMIYDQGFEVIIDGKKFFAFNKYKLNKKTELVKSYCGRTSFGWYHDKNGDTNYGCFYGKNIKTKGSKITYTVSHSEQKLKKFVTKKSKKFTNEHELIVLINKHQKSWKAAPNKKLEGVALNKIHKRNGKKQSRTQKKLNLIKKIKKFKKLKQIKKLRKELKTSNLLTKKLILQLNTQRNKILIQNEKKFQKKKLKSKKKKIKKIKKIKLPENFDWRNVSGINYVSPVRNQKSCGSCYIFGSLAAIESRIRIQSKNKFKPILSPQEIISCSNYSQKCHGGFPYEVAKYGQDYYMVPESCFKYKYSQEISCNEKCKNPKFKVKIQDYNYIGGYYGASNEQNMMEEIYKNGPIAVNILVLPDFSYYQSGVYYHLPGVVGKYYQDKDKNVNDWEPVDHTVAIVGWGFDKKSKMKYWIVKNSWGTSFGDKGYINIRRGVDECSIESTVLAFKPKVIPNN